MEEINIEPKTIWNITILIIIGIIIGILITVYLEYNSAKQSCIEKDSEFDFQFPNKYLCNQKPFLKYSDGSWDWEREVNVSQVWLP